jgi:hypothetical protein
MGRTACTEPQCLYKGALYLTFTSEYSIYLGTVVTQWLRYCATNQKVVGSFPGGVIGIFIDINPSDRTMALGSTQLLKEMTTRIISWG